MITQMMSVSIYVLDLERALSFYIDKLGFRMHTEIQFESDSRWVSLYVPSEPEHQILLIPVEEGSVFKGEQVEQMRKLVSQEIFSYGVFKCRNLQETYHILKNKGVRFLMAPGEGFLDQYEASFIDDSGNWFRLTQDADAI